MFIEEKIEGAMRISHEKAMQVPTEIMEQGLQNVIEKGDVLAMILSAFIVILPGVVVALGVMVSISMLFFG